ncbi:MAG: hypothetical protein AAF449_03360 [Myxococcota bacterium]
MNLLSWLREKPVSEEAIQAQRARRDAVQDARAKAYASQMVDAIAVNKAAERTRTLERSATHLAKAAKAVPADPGLSRAAAKAQRRAVKAQATERRLTNPPPSMFGILKILLTGQFYFTRFKTLKTAEPPKPSTAVPTGMPVVPWNADSPDTSKAPRVNIPSPVEQAIARRDAILAEVETEIISPNPITAEAGR